MFGIPVHLCPSSPQPPSPTRGEGVILGVLMPEMEDSTQELPNSFFKDHHFGLHSAGSGRRA